MRGKDCYKKVLGTAPRDVEGRVTYRWNGDKPNTMSDAETYLDEKIHSSGPVSGLDNVEGDLDRDEVYSPREQRKILHKIDRRLVTGLGLLMCVSLVDRTNLGNAMIAG